MGIRTFQSFPGDAKVQSLGTAGLAGERRCHTLIVKRRYVHVALCGWVIISARIFIIHLPLKSGQQTLKSALLCFPHFALDSTLL